MYARKLVSDIATAKRFEEFIGKLNPKFSDLPNLKKVTAEKFWHWRSIYMPEAMSQLIGQDIEGSHGTPMLFMVNYADLLAGGYAVVYYHYGDKRGQTEYYSWAACEHSFTEKKLGNCYYEYKCSKCGRSYTVDSSD